ncbi:hypothetical protein CXB51_008048 [Gossypium anomalum]|uniref:Aminotransferase-like plant mobile domain-containing protein n=1 Tax=Gossypium anomalum TaxID=47600 RepID=A0A8J6D5T5_9ROSI|nr:hypothetical protein CXB51_008048 [Gossypium anomalum]
MASEDPHISFAVWGVHHHPTGCWTAARAPHRENVVTDVSSISRPTVLCYNLLERSLSEGKFTSLRFSWLKANFEHLPSTVSEWKVMHTVRAYIMHIIRGVLMPDANGNKVHLMYLPLLFDLHNIRSYSWGFVVLAMLYCELCRMTNPSAVDIGECLILLQSWCLILLQSWALY